MPLIIFGLRVLSNSIIHICSLHFEKLLDIISFSNKLNQMGYSKANLTGSSVALELGFIPTWVIFHIS